MVLPEFVTRRGERLYYRRAFPHELWPITGHGIPTNAQKLAALKGRPLPEQIAEAKRLGLPTLAPKTNNEGSLDPGLCAAPTVASPFLFNVARAFDELERRGDQRKMLPRR